MITERASHTKTTRGSDRSYGLVFAAVFLIVGLWPLTDSEGAVRVWALGVAGVLMAAAVFHPALLAPINKLWFVLGLVMHAVVSPLIMAAVFFLVVTPIGLIRRVFVRDPLGLRPDPSATSYWVVKETPIPPPGSMRRQF
ncbi:MAG: hypothetical protein HQ481_08925 [Alphaproteobacteria bacterium]|nr:hypothetical protein [Alphaproteobacteria bacterium]